MVHIANILSYEQYVGVELNQDILETRAAYRIYLGLRMFYNRGPVPREWLEAVCDNEEQIKAMLWKSQTEATFRKAYDALGRR